MERREVEMQKRLQELQAESEIAELRSKKAFEKHQLRLQIEEAEGSVRASSICPSLMSLTLEEDKNSDIKSWLNQGVEDFDKCFSQPKESSREVENRGESSKPPQTFDHKNELKAEVQVSHTREKSLEIFFRKQTPCFSKAMRNRSLNMTSRNPHSI